MTAFVLALAMAIGTGAYVRWAERCIDAGAPSWWFVLGAPLAYVAPALVIVTLSFALAWLWRTPRPPEARIGLRATARLYCTEVCVVALSWPLMVLHRWLMRDPAPAPAKHPVLLVHGVLVNDGVWLFFRRELIRRGVGSIYTLSYGPPLADIELFAEQLATKIDAVRSSTGAARVVLVGHSMGGLVARAYLRRFGGGAVARLITLGTPHHGSVLAYLFPGRSLAQLHPGNPWLAELNRGESAAPPAPTVSIWSWHDSMVAPQASAVFGGADNVAFTGIAHNALLADQEVRGRVAREIADCAAGPSGAAKVDLTSTRRQ
ncbi:MAG TPA: alpha/beta fold hydrolase [Casimicrobiaceae bacterium]|nr:alpha/beta fold hydrolase [Casimicrobiaceae bacterium]